MTGEAGSRHSDVIDSRAAWLRLGISLALATIGSIGLWSYVVSLPAVQAEFGVTRAEASLPYTLTMLGFAAGFGCCSEAGCMAATRGSDLSEEPIRKRLPSRCAKLGSSGRTPCLACGALRGGGTSAT